MKLQVNTDFREHLKGFLENRAVFAAVEAGDNSCLDQDSVLVGSGNNLPVTAGLVLRLARSFHRAAVTHGRMPW